MLRPQINIASGTYTDRYFHLIRFPLKNMGNLKRAKSSQFSHEKTRTCSFKSVNTYSRQLSTGYLFRITMLRLTQVWIKIHLYIYLWLKAIIGMCEYVMLHFLNYNFGLQITLTQKSIKNQLWWLGSLRSHVLIQQIMLLGGRWFESRLR